MTQIAEHTSSLEMATPSEPAAVPALEVHDLRKEFIRRDGGKRKGWRRKRRRVAALKGVSFTMERGETVAILGQNGSGKSTLVRLLSTLLLHEGGSASIFGHDVFKDTRAVKRLVNRVSVEASFFKKMSAVENLSYAARFYGMRGKDTKDQIPEILTRVGFPEDRRNEPMENLSRGMQQKVALARALLTSPVMLLLDEPTTGLDPRSKLEVQEFIREIRETHDATILLCTHDLAEAEVLADRVGILDRGELLSSSPRASSRPLRRRDVEDAFFAATGKSFEEEGDDEDEKKQEEDEMPGHAAVRHELIGLLGVIERNWYLIKRYIVGGGVVRLDGREHADDRLHRQGRQASGGTLEVKRTTTVLLIGAVVWAYLGIIFEIVTETVAWERWEGTIEYTFMAPLSRVFTCSGWACSPWSTG